jgi:hypothetical protein
MRANSLPFANSELTFANNVRLNNEINCSAKRSEGEEGEGGGFRLLFVSLWGFFFFSILRRAMLHTKACLGRVAA